MNPRSHKVERGTRVPLLFMELFIVSDKVRVRGEDVKRLSVR